MALKICYIFTSAGLHSDSVQKKVIAQINALNEVGVECRGAFFTNDVMNETPLNENITLIPYSKSHRKYFNTIRQKKLLIAKVSAYIDSTLSQKEFIYLRYPGASAGLYRFAKKNKGLVISEHQAKEIHEILSAGKEHPLGLSINKLISYFLYQWWPVMNEKVWGRPYSRMLKAKVAVTKEIGEYQQKYCENVWIIPNGIETIGYQVRKQPELKDELKILFLKGTSGMSTWNGIDRLVYSIDAYKATGIRIQLIICGSILLGEIPEREYIVQKGYLESDELDELFSTVHIGFSTLCLFRKNLYEAAVLKAREYMARGLPFVYAYDDPDIDPADDINAYLLRVPNDESIIDFNAVVTFARSVSKDETHPVKMRKFAEEKLDWKVKMNKLKLMLSE